MQQAYSSSNAAASYMNSAPSFYNTSSYPYTPLSATRSLNPACKASTGYLSSPYSTPTSPFQSSGHTQVPQYGSYGGYGSAGAGTFAQGFSQVCGRTRLFALLKKKKKTKEIISERRVWKLRPLSTGITSRTIRRYLLCSKPTDLFSLRKFA